ncbi:MAG: type II secretion system F family protein, partial [Candidatus Humimicrobiaceae bacterium]
ISTLSGQNIYNSIKILIEKYKGEICEEFKQFISDINFGIGKEFAYANLEKKPNTKEFKDLILLLKNAESCGSSVSEILKQKSNYLKFSISQNIERKSRKVSLLILFPLAFLILPSFILLVGGPLIFSIGGDFLV